MRKIYIEDPHYCVKTIICVFVLVRVLCRVSVFLW